MTHTLLPADLVIGGLYVGSDETADLAGATFRLDRIDGPEIDMADHEVEFYRVDVTVGAETWTDLILPADAPIWAADQEALA